MSRVLDKQAFLRNPEIHPPSTPTSRSISTRRQRRRKHVLICGHTPPVSIGKFQFERDEYFAHITYPKGLHIIPIDNFLRSLMRDVAWGFFYGTVNFDNVFGTVNHYARSMMRPARRQTRINEPYHWCGVL